MEDDEKLIKKLHSGFKLSGFAVRREFCCYILETLRNDNISLTDDAIFDDYFNTLCTQLGKHCISNKSIEKEQIVRVVEIALNSGYDKRETTFSVINAFDFPKFMYDPDRKIYLPATVKPNLLAGPNSKTQLYLDRYTTILQRTQRNFKYKIASKLCLQTVDYLLSRNKVTLTNTMVLGSLTQISEGKYYLEDPSGMVALDLSHARYEGGFFAEHCFVLAHGDYDDKVLYVSSLIIPPGEEYENSIPSFGNLNYFGGPSLTPLRKSQNLQEQFARQQNENDEIMLFSDVWLDHPMIFDKLKLLFDEVSRPPIAFIFMGDFLQDFEGFEKVDKLMKLFKQFGELLSNYSGLIHNSKFVFVPSMTDPCHLHIVPRFPLPSKITEDFRKFVPNAIFATNPCRLQYYTKEITLFRADVLSKLKQGSIDKSDELSEEDVAAMVTRTIVGQGHLSPLSLNALTVSWDFDYTLRLYPSPNLIVIGDKSKCFNDTYKGCRIINPGPFCTDEEFIFSSYYPFKDRVIECSL